ncbi:MAG: hypothetical protein SH820_09605 [Xanthomonadales bacterium]|nr:hypothetical protein [Xanthomonadales bacterium]
MPDAATKATTKADINLPEKFKLFNYLWSPHVIAELNDCQVKLARIDGEFIWHDHPGYLG